MFEPTRSSKEERHAGSSRAVNNVVRSMRSTWFPARRARIAAGDRSSIPPPPFHCRTTTYVFSGVSKAASLLASQGLATAMATLGGPMKGTNEFRRWVAMAPPGTMVSTKTLAEMFDILDVEPVPETTRGTTPPLPWTLLLWTADSETRIGRAELLEAVGRSASWLYRHTGPKAKHRIPHRTLDSELIFLVGEVRRWLRDHEEIVVAGPIDAAPHSLKAV